MRYLRLCPVDLVVLVVRMVQLLQIGLVHLLCRRRRHLRGCLWGLLNPARPVGLEIQEDRGFLWALLLQAGPLALACLEAPACLHRLLVQVVPNHPKTKCDEQKTYNNKNLHVSRQVLEVQAVLYSPVHLSAPEHLPYHAALVVPHRLWSPAALAHPVNPVAHSVLRKVFNPARWKTYKPFGPISPNSPLTPAGPGMP